MLAGTMLFGLPNMSKAEDHDGGDWDSHHHYRVDKEGYWDDHHQHQKFVFWHHHRGYWDERGEKRIFITVGD